ncbi:MAG: ferredoxin [Planctomycetes bacterium]|nr:ferredoxin [Planctomycetota bacterium]
MAISHIWFTGGCIRCSACAYAAPQVFELPAGGDATVQGCARRDGIGTSEDAFALAVIDDDQEQRIRDAADGCPVAIIHIRENG